MEYDSADELAVGFENQINQTERIHGFEQFDGGPLYFTQFKVKVDGTNN